MTIEFSTRQFEFSHGHRPRGEGMWIFDVRRPGRPVDGQWPGRVQVETGARSVPLQVAAAMLPTLREWDEVRRSIGRRLRGRKRASDAG